MSYLENLNEQANYTRTLNGALTHGSTGDAYLILFNTPKRHYTVESYFCLLFCL